MDKSVDDLMLLKAFLSTKLALYVFECFKYRMKYLEKYAFEMIPDITKLKDFPEKITNKSVNDYFKFTDYEIENVNNLNYFLLNFNILHNFLAKNIQSIRIGGKIGN